MRQLLATLAACVAVFLAVFGIAYALIPPDRPAPDRGAETIYIKNEAPRYMSNASIKKQIPAWEAAANQDFAPIWHTPQVSIKLLNGPAPRGAVVAYFQKTGDVQGALAYHTITRGVPSITVYTGVGDFYGFSNSVSFTHELFETLADEFVSGLNAGFAPSIYIGQIQHTFPYGGIFINEVSDPVEAYAYRLDGASISDFVTPDWWADGTHTGLDFMGVLQHPFQIAGGGYASYFQGGQWYQITNFRHAGRDAAGFYKGEQLERR